MVKAFVQELVNMSRAGTVAEPLRVVAFRHGRCNLTGYRMHSPSVPGAGTAMLSATGTSGPGRSISYAGGAGGRSWPIPSGGRSTPDREELIRRLLLERVSLRGIARSAGVSWAWLQRFVNRLYREDTPHTPGRLNKSRAT